MDVYPVHLFDNAENYRRLYMCFIFQFNDILDGQKLADALSTLVQVGDWRKLGGRLRSKKDGHLEICVPSEFTPEEPAIAFSQAQHDASIHEHPLGKQLPELADAGAGGAPQPLSSHRLRDFAGPPTAPRSMREVMDRGAPLTSLHVTRFADATVVAVIWPHVLMDAMGLQALLRNWSLVLHGRAAEVEPLAGVHDDPIEELLDQGGGGREQQQQQPREELLLERMRPGTMGMLVMLFRFLWQRLWHTYEERTLVLTRESVDRLCRGARQDLAAEAAGGGGGGGGDDNRAALISENDVLAAWGAQMVAAASQPRAAAVPITVGTYVNLRFKLRALQRRTYLQNLLMFTYSSLAPGGAGPSLGRAALDYRAQCAEQTTEPQVASYLAMQREHVRASRTLSLAFGSPRAAILTVNNLSKVDFFRHVDFSAAVVDVHGDAEAVGMQASKAQRRNPPGTIVFYHSLAFNKPSPVNSHVQILGRDHSGRVLVTGSFESKTWDVISEAVKRL